MRLSKEQLMKLVEAKEYMFQIKPYNGNADDVFKRIYDINVNARLDYFEDKCDVDIVCTYKAELYDVNTHKVCIREFNFDTYFVVSDEYFEEEFFVYMFEKNTLNLENIIKEEIYYRLPLDFTEVDEIFEDEEQFYFKEYNKIKDQKIETQATFELEKLKDLFE